jgi:tetratricopeptide (TPR) repeat protein
MGVKRIFFWGPDVIDPPTPPLSDVDPAVREALEDHLEKVRQSPRSPEAWGTLGMVFTSHAFGEQALACFAQAERLDPQDSRWPYNQGLIFLAYDPLAALPKIRRAVQLCGDAVQEPELALRWQSARLRLAELGVRLGRSDEAREHFQALLQRDSTHPRAHLGLARLYFQAGEMDRCREHLPHALAHPAARRSALTLHAQLLRRQGNLTAARRELARAIDLPREPDWPDEYVAEALPYKVGESARLQQAEHLLDQGRPADSIQRLREIVQTYPRSARAWTLLGWAQLMQQDLPAAEKALHAARKLDPGSARVYLYLGNARYEQQDYRSAIGFFRKAIERKPDSLQAQFNLGLSLKKEGEPRAAISAFREAVRCQPLSAAAHVQLGELLAQDKQYDEAQSHLKQAIELNPADGHARKLLEELRGKHPGAKKPSRDRSG